MSESLANYGTVVSQQYFGRVFYSNEADSQALEIVHQQQGTISVATEGEIKIGSMSSGKYTSIKQGTLSTSYASVSTITDGTALVKGGTVSGVVHLTSNTITDGTAVVKAGSVSGVVHLTSNTITDGTAVVKAGSVSGVVHLTANTITDGTASLASGEATGLVTVNSTNATITTARITTLEDGTTTLNSGSVTGAVYVSVATLSATVGSVSQLFRASTITDNVATLKAGSVSGVVHLTANTITDGTAVVKAGSVSGVVHLTANTITDGTAVVKSGSVSGVVHLTANTITDGTASLIAGKATSLVTVNSANATITTARITTLEDGTTTLNSGSVTGAVYVSVATLSATVGSVSELFRASTITDNVATLKAGSVSGVVHLSANTITDGTAVVKAGSVSGVVHLSANTITDGTAVVKSGSVSGVVHLTSNTVTDGTAVIKAGSVSGVVHLTANTITDGTASLAAGKATDLVTVNSSNATITNVRATKFLDGIATLTGGSISSLKRLGVNTDAPLFSLDIGSVTDAIKLPVGTSAQRPTLGTGNTLTDADKGLVRYNTTTNQFEGYYGASKSWAALGGSGLADLDSDTYITVDTNDGDTDIITFTTAGTDRLKIESDGDIVIQTNTTLTSGNLSLINGTLSGGLHLTANTITDGTAVVQAGTVSGVVHLTANTITDGTAVIKAGSVSGVVNLSANTITDGTAIIRNGSVSSVVHLSANTITDGMTSIKQGSVSGVVHLTANTITDGTAVVKAGSVSGVVHLTANTITDGNASLAGGKATNLITVNTLNATITTARITTLDDSIATLSGGSITNLKLTETDVASVTTIAFIEKLTDGTLTMEHGSLTGGANTWVSAAVGSFTDLYAHDLFVADDLVLNGSTSVVNSTQVAFEDKLLSLGVSSGRDVTDRTNAVLTLTGDLTAYAANAYVLLMNTSDGSQGIFQISSKSGQAVTLTTTPNGATFASGANPGLYVGILGDISNATNAGFEIMGYTGAGTDAAKRVRYIHDASKPAFEFTSENTALDVRVKNTSTTVSYFSVNNGSASKRLLTEDALFLDTTSSGTITGSQRTDEKAAIYLSRNADADDASGDWRMLIDSNGKFSIQKYSGTYGVDGAWQSKWQVA